MLIRTRRHRSNRAAFTLMEMMIVVAIIVALAGIGIFYFVGQADEGNKTKARADIKNLTQAVNAYKLARPHIGWPASLEILLQRDEYGPPLIESAESLLDPWGRPYQYDVNGGRNNGLKPDIWCEMPGTLGTASNWTNKIIYSNQ